MAKTDALEHYDTIHNTATMEANSARDRAVKLNAAQYGLNLAGLEKNTESGASIPAILIQINNEMGRGDVTKD